MAIWGKRTDTSARTGTALASSDPHKRGMMTGLERARHERQVSMPQAAEVPPAWKSVRPAAAPVQPAADTQPPALPLSVAAAPERTASAGPVSPPSAPVNANSMAQLYAGAGVKLKGEISGCDSFRVEGDVEGQVSARHIVVAQNGVFKGTAQVEEAEVEGTVEGTLNVSGHLFLRSTGRLQGNVSYGQIEIERGGEVAGDVNPYSQKPAQAAAPPRQSTPAAPGAVVPIAQGPRKVVSGH